MAPRKRAKTSHNQDGSRASSPATAETSTDAATTDVARVPPRRNVRGRRGGLQGMVDMPLDVVLEIAQYLHPRDLLNLARTDKSYRAFFMSRKQEPVWKTARAQVQGLPDIPRPWFCEPAYANLMFFTNCHSCNKPNIQHVYYQFGVRYCQGQCSSNILPSTDVAPLLHEVRKELGDIAKKDFLYTEYARSRRGFVYFKPQVDAFHERWKELTDKEERIKLVQEYREDAVARGQVSYELDKWASGRRQNRKQEIDKLKTARFHAVQTRLEEEGWSKELDFMNGEAYRRLYNIPAVCKSTKLTDRSWSNMRDTVLKLMQEYRNQRLIYERTQLVKSRARLLGEAFAAHLEDAGRTEGPLTDADSYLPSAGDLAYLPEFRELLEAKPEVTVTKEDFTSLLGAWPELVARWTELQRSKFKSMLLPALKDTGAANDEEVLDLAIATFDCSNWRCYSTARLRWPFILGHPCLREYSMGYSGYNYNGIIQNTTSLGGVFHPYARPCDYLREMRAVIRMCGHDPNTVTWDAMQESPARLACKMCSTPDKYKVFDWLAAVEHERRAHGYNRDDTSPAMWQRLPDDQAVQAAKVADALDASTRDHDMYETSGHHMLACRWCIRARPKYQTHMILHLKEKHKKTDPVSDVDYYVPEEDMPRMRRGITPVWMYSDALADDDEAKKIVEAGQGFFAHFPPESESCAANEPCTANESCAVNEPCAAQTAAPASPISISDA